MSLGIFLTATRTIDVYGGNITGNLVPMAKAAGIYEHLWNPHKLGITTAEQLIDPLRQALAKLTDAPEYFQKYNPSNGWGDYDGFVRFVGEYLDACESNPDAKVHVW